MQNRLQTFTRCTTSKPMLVKPRAREREEGTEEEDEGEEKKKKKGVDQRRHQ